MRSGYHYDLVLNTCRWLPSHCNLRWQGGAGESVSSLVSLLVRALIHHEVPTLTTSSKPNYLAKTSSQNPVTLGVMATICEFEWGGHNQSRAISELVGAEQGTEHIESSSITHALCYAPWPPCELGESVLFLHTNDCTYLQLNFYNF